MLEPSLPPDEDQRIATLRGLGILDTPLEERFDRITRIASRLFNVPIALISFIDSDRQWIKSRQGLSITEIPRSDSFCGYAILNREILIVPDAKRDPRFSENPMVNGPPFLRFYAGCPLAGPDGRLLGTLSVLDRRPRRMSKSDLMLLKDLASEVEEALGRIAGPEGMFRENEARCGKALNITERKRVETERQAMSYRNEALVKELEQIVYDWKPAADELIWEGDYTRVLGYSPQEMGATAESWTSRVHPDDLGKVLAEVEQATRERRNFDLEYRFLHKDGSYRWMRDRGVLSVNIQGELERMIGIFSDITGRKQAEEALQESRRTLSTLISNLPGAAYRCRNDKDWTIEFVSKGILPLTGYSPSDFIERKIAFGQIIHRDDQESVWNGVQAALKERTSFQFVYRILTASGEEKWVWEQGQGIFSPTGELLFLEGFVSDITEQKRTEKALQENEARLRAIIDHEPECVKLVDHDGNLLDMNPAGLRMIEADSLAQVGGHCVFPLVVEEHREAFQQLHERVLQGESASMIFDIISLKGNRRTLETHETPLWDSSGEIFAALGITRDITERKQAEEALEDAEARLRLAIQAGRIGTWDWNMLTGRIVWSRGHEELWGMAPGEFKGTYEEFEARLHPEDRDGLNRAVAEAISERRTYRHEFRIVWPDGSVHWIAGQGQPFLDGAGKPVRMLGVVMDITERKRTEEEIQRLNQDLERRVAERTAQLEAVNKEIESFSYSVSHDLRTPLRAMGGFSRILLNQYADRLDAQGRDFLQRVDAASRRMAELIEDLLNLSRITRREMRKEALDLTVLAQSVSEEIRKSDPERKVIFLIQDRLKAEGDPRLLRIALENLLGNAWKFTSNRPKATIEFGQVEQEGRPVYFVRDDGAGFDMAYADKLFGAFQRLHSQSEFEGTGIGLATVQRIIHRHGGKIWAEGEVGKGATFYFTI